MRLMRRTVEAETHEAKHADEHTIELVEPPILPEEPMRCFVESDGGTVHEMTRD